MNSETLQRQISILQLKPRGQSRNEKEVIGLPWKVLDRLYPVNEEPEKLADIREVVCNLYKQGLSRTHIKEKLSIKSETVRRGIEWGKKNGLIDMT